MTCIRSWIGCLLFLIVGNVSMSQNIQVIKYPDLENMLKSQNDTVLIVNFWATWCAPCVEELPLINDFYRLNKAKGWQVLGLAIDKPSAVLGFLKKIPLDFPVGMAGLVGAELGRGLGNVTGGLPFTAVLGAKGDVLYRKMGLLHAEDLDKVLGLK